MSFRWVITQPEHAEAISNLMEVLNVPESIARLLAIRGISSFEDAKQVAAWIKQLLLTLLIQLSILSERKLRNFEVR